MGSSSAFTVGLINLCNAYQGRYIGREALAAEACAVEIDRLGEPIGKQDQYGCALGGLNFIRFHPDDSVTCEAVPVSIEARQQLERNLTLFYLGGTRSASDLLRVQSRRSGTDRAVIAALTEMATQAESLRQHIATDPDQLGTYLHEGWQLKKQLADGVTNDFVDRTYQRARAAGASGGKLLGAGDSGFLLVYTPGDTALDVQAELKEFDAHPVRFDTVGSSIIYSD